jgi:hypothetical protein
MAKSRVKGGGVNSGRAKRKFMGKGCSSVNKKVKASMPRRVHLKYPGLGLGSRYEEYKRQAAEEVHEQHVREEREAEEARQDEGGSTES